jgi:hypothetical protein
LRRALPSGARTATAALALLLGFTFSTTPVVAGERGAILEKSPTRPSLAAAATAKLAAAPIPARALAQAADAPAEDPTGFFKRPAGKAAIVLMVAGTAWMAYSAFHDNDPVHSPFR